MARYLRFQNEVLVNTVTAGDQRDPAIAALPSGGFVVLWDDYGTGNIKGQLFDALGSRVGGEILVNTSLNGTLLCAVAPLATGGFVACWMDLKGGRQCVVGQMFDMNGAKVGAEFVVDTTPAAYDQFAPAIAPLAGGGFVMVWEGYGSQSDGSESGIRAQRFDATGAQVGGSFLLNISTAGLQLSPALAATGNGGFVAAWVDIGSGMVRARIFDAAGQPLSAEASAGSSLVLVDTPPGVLALPNGGFVLTWTETSGVKACIFLADGTALAPAFLVGTGNAPSVAALSGGGFIISWASGNVKAQAFDAAGNRIGGEHVVNTSSGGTFPALAAVGGGGIAAAWVGGDTSGQAIRSQVFYLGIEGTVGDDTLSGSTGIDYLLLDQGGVDAVFAGDGDDRIYFGGTFDAADSIDGGVNGNDRLILQGDYSAGLTLDPSRISGVYTLELVSGFVTTYGLPGTTPFSYDLVIGGAGISVVDGSTLLSNEQMFIDGSDEAVTAFFMQGGSGSDELSGGALGDTLRGGEGNDSLVGNGGNDLLYGDGGNDILDGGFGNDLLFLTSGDDVASGGAGDDGFYFGAAYTAADTVDGGAGTYDQVGLQGNYSGGVSLGSLLNTELVVLLPGNDTRFGDTANNLYDYNITANAGTIVSNNRLTIQANTLRAGEDLTFNGSTTAIDFLIYGGFGVDTLTGGSGNDGFFFGQGRFGASDVVNGGAGTLDQLGLQGNFTGGNAITFGAGQFSGLEFIVLLSAGDNRFGSIGGTVSYDLTMNNDNIAAGQRMIVSANTLKANESLTFNGSAELDGFFQIFSGLGNDLLIGSQGADDIHARGGADTIEGRGGADTLRGGDGNDTFVYRAISDSTAAAKDRILDFATGDKIGLVALAANTGGSSFTFVGGSSQSGARQVQVVQDDNAATVNVFIDADHVADLMIDVTVADGHALTAADFIGVTDGPGAGWGSAVADDADLLWSARHDGYGDLHGLGRDMAIL